MRCDPNIFLQNSVRLIALSFSFPSRITSLPHSPYSEQTSAEIRWRAFYDGIGLPVIALSATMFGFAAMAREAGLTYFQTIASTALIWGLPGQVAMVGLWASGATLLLIFFAVTMANMRMLLMTISASDIMDMKAQNIGKLQHFAYFHLLAITGWVQIGYRAEDYSASQLMIYYKSFTAVIFTLSLTGTSIGFFVSQIAPSRLLVILVYITPLYLILLGLSARQPANRLAVALGGLYAAFLYPFLADMALFIAGFAGGITALLITLTREKNRQVSDE